MEYLVATVFIIMMVGFGMVVKEAVEHANLKA